jgi:hypothetical protein
MDPQLEELPGFFTFLRAVIAYRDDGEEPAPRPRPDFASPGTCSQARPSRTDGDQPPNHLLKPGEGAVR